MNRPAQAPLLLALLALGAGCSDASEPSAAPATVPVKVVAPGGAVYPADASGRAMVLRGWEFSRDACPDDPFADAERELPAMAALGYDAVRVPINWECIEPTEGRYDEAYLASYDRLFASAAAAGVLLTPDLNAHFPAWILEKTGRQKVSDSPLSSHGDPQFIGAYGLVYDDAAVHAHLLEVWRMMALRWRDEPALFGWDLWNEPWYDPIPTGASLGDFDAAMAAEQTKLTPWYQEVTDAIRGIDRQHWILLEPFWGGVASLAKPTRLGVIHDPEGKVAYAPHVYDLAMEAGGDYAPASHFLADYWEAVIRYPTEQSLPLLVWEWGPRDPTTPNAAAYVQGVLDGIDAHAAGSMAFAWCKGLGGWCGLDANGRPGGANAVLVGATAPRIAGTPLRMTHHDGVFHLEYAPSGQGVTEVVVPKAAYPQGYGVALVGAARTSTAGASVDVLRLVAAEGATLVTLDVTPQ